MSFKNFIKFRHLIIISSLLFFIIMGTAFFLVYQNAGVMREQVNNDFNQQQLILARQIAFQINSILHDIQIEIENLKNFYRYKELIKYEYLIKSTFNRTKSKGLIEIGILTPNGKIIERYHNDDLQQLITPSKIIQNCSLNNSNQMLLGKLNLELNKSKNTIITTMFCTPIYFENNKLKGILFAKLDVSKLIKEVTSNIRSGKTGYSWVIDQTGMFLFHPVKEFIGQNAFTARKKRKPYVSFSQINQIMKYRMLKGEEGTGIYISGWHRGIEGEITKLIAFTPVKSPLIPRKNIWGVAVEVPNSVDTIIFIDNNNLVRMWNKWAEMIFGYTAEEMIGKSFHRLIPPDINADEELKRIQKEVLEKGYIKNYQDPRMTKDNRRITIDLSRSLVYSNKGEIIGSIAIIKDVTEKTELEQKIYNTEKLASIGTLAAGVAHEINNPLSIIFGFIDLLSEKFQPNSPEYEDLKIIEENTNNAKKIVENLLGFARITEGLEDTVDIKHSIDTIINIVKNTLMTKKINLVTKIPERLPKIKGDTREFQQVIFNLINNSISAMNETGGGTLTLSACIENNWVHISVSDTGIGIPDKIKSQIFDPFFTTKKVGEGTGLGLSLCYGIVKKYGGKIDFTSISREDTHKLTGKISLFDSSLINENKIPYGTTFTVSMPVQSSNSEKGEKIE